MKKLLLKLIRTIFMAALAAGVFFGSFFYENNFSTIIAMQRDNQVILDTTLNEQINVARSAGSVQAGKGFELKAGDTIQTGNFDSFSVKFSGDGVMRLGSNTRVLITLSDNIKSQYAFKILSGKVWLNNLYSNADVNVLVEGGVILPGQSSSYYNVTDGQSDIYSNQSDILLAFVPVDFASETLIDENSAQVINKLFIPQGTSASVFANKIKENQSTISQLLFSKLVKEFNYGPFDKMQLNTDLWLSNNLVQDIALTSKIRDVRLEKIRTRGLKYSTLDASNYQLDQFLLKAANSLTFSEEKVGSRNLDALYDYLYDAQYLFDYGRINEAQQRLTNFTSLANQLFIVYGDQLEAQYKSRIKQEYDYLSFANPSDSLFQLKLTLQKIYLDSIKGEKNEFQVKLAFLTQQLNTVGYYAENKNFKDLKITLDNYFASFKTVTEQYKDALTANITLIQRQNQSLDNLFMQYPDFYREAFITNKILLENNYLSSLSASNDKVEELQSVVAKRIDFLRQLQFFYLQGLVPLSDTQRSVELLFNEIGKVQLDPVYQTAISQLFKDRLAEYGVFSQFLSSPEYVNSNSRGATPQRRFDQFKKDSAAATTTTKPPILVPADSNTPIPVIPAAEETTAPPINEETVTQTVDGNTTTNTNQVDTNNNSEENPTTTTDTPKVPKVKRTNS